MIGKNVGQVLPSKGRKSLKLGVLRNVNSKIQEEPERGLEG